MNDFEEKKEKWLKEVAEQCHEFALKIDLDFYAFQTPIIYNPDLLIIGINPGKSGKYSDYLLENMVTQRKPESLYYTQNLLVEEAENWKDGMSQIRIKFKEIFFNDFLFSKLKNSVMMNMIYFNTTSSSEIKELGSEIEKYCLEKTAEVINILEPKNILIFTSDGSLLKKIGVKNIIQEDKFLKFGDLNGNKTYAIPHFSARGYNSKEIRNSIGEQLNKVLK